MKKHLHFYILLVIMPFAAILFMAQSNGAPLVGTQGLTGSPGDFGNCTLCHSSDGADYSASLDITTSIPTGGYALGQTYTISVIQTSSGASRYGFQITAENTAAAKIGGFAVTDATNTQIQLGGTLVTHTLAGNDQKTWSFDWTAPSTDVGAITFYAASNAADGNDNIDND